MNIEKEIRLYRVAKEFSVGVATIVDFLTKKGYTIDNNPNARITAKQYELLRREYTSDQMAKKQSEKETEIEKKRSLTHKYQESGVYKVTGHIDLSMLNTQTRPDKKSNARQNEPTPPQPIFSEKTKDTDEIALKGDDLNEFDGEKEEESTFEGPFDPNDIDVDIAVVNLGSLLEMLEYGEIDLSPEFQRSSDLWNSVQKSRLIESILLGLPLPSFYFSEEVSEPSSINFDDNETISNKSKPIIKLVVVDGLQRLCTLKDFWIDKTLKLEGLQFLTYLNGMSVDDLERSQIRRIKSLKITLNTLRKNTPTNVKYVLFQRINTAGVPLNQQEMRNALYQGAATHLLKGMVALPSFKQATGNRVSSKRMTDCDFANRFLAFYLGVNHYKSELDAFMADALKQVNEMDDKEVKEIYHAFDDSMNVCYQLFGDKAFRRFQPQMPTVFLKVNKALFDVLSVSIALLSHKEQAILVENKNTFSEKMNDLFSNDDMFINSITVGTTKEPQVKYRFTRIKELINLILNHDK